MQLLVLTEGNYAAKVIYYSEKPHCVPLESPQCLFHVMQVKLHEEKVVMVN